MTVLGWDYQCSQCTTTIHVREWDSYFNRIPAHRPLGWLVFEGLDFCGYRCLGAYALNKEPSV